MTAPSTVLFMILLLPAVAAIATTVTLLEYISTTVPCFIVHLIVHQQQQQQQHDYCDVDDNRQWHVHGRSRFVSERLITFFILPC